MDSGTDRVYQDDAAVNRTSGSLAASGSFALVTGNANQGIADPPVGNSTPAAVEASSSGAVAAPVLGGFPSVSATGQVSTPADDQDEQHAQALYWSEVGNPAAVLSADVGISGERGFCLLHFFPVAGTGLPVTKPGRFLPENLPPEKRRTR